MKIQVYTDVVIPTLLYGAETRFLYRKQIRLLERFHQRCLRSILGIKWLDYVSNVEVFKRASLPSLESILLQAQLRWAGHVSRMEDIRKPKEESVIVELQESVTKTSLHMRESAMGHGSMRSQTETVGAHRLVSSWILTSCQPHRIVSGRSTLLQIRHIGEKSQS